jgi:hypothetical protein
MNSGSPLFTSYVNSGGWGGETKQEKKKKGRRANLRWLLSLAKLLEAIGSGANGGAGGSRWFFSLFVSVFFFLYVFLLFFVPSFFLSFFLCRPLFCSNCAPQFSKTIPPLFFSSSVNLPYFSLFCFFLFFLSVFSLPPLFCSFFILSCFVSPPASNVHVACEQWRAIVHGWANSGLAQKAESG